MKRFILSVIITLVHFYTFSQISILTKKFDKKVKYIKNKYEMPFESNYSNIIYSKNIWVVYSDKNNNFTYKDPNQSVQLKTINFLDSFYVIKTSGDMLEIIKYNSNALKSKNILKVHEKIEYYGWINKSNLLLNSKSFLDKSNKQPLKYLTLLNGTQLFPNLFNNWDGKWIPVYNDPELKNLRSESKLKTNEIVFVYKKIKDKFLVGNKTSFSTSNSKETILGWVDAGYIQQWSSRLSITPHDLNNLDTTHQLLFPAKNHATNFEKNLITSIPIDNKNCTINNTFWMSNPFFDETSVVKNNTNYKLIHTGTTVKPFENKNAYIYNSLGEKINYSSLCSLTKTTKKTNIIFAINYLNDTKEYYTNIIQTFQELDLFLDSKNKPNYSFGLIDCNAINSSEIIIKDHYSEILSLLVSITKESVQVKKQIINQSILDGFTKTLSFLKNHAGENNVIILISSQGDNNTTEVIYKSKLEKIITEFVITNTKLILYQPYSCAGTNYTNFVTQAKFLLKKYGENSIQIKKNLQVHQTEQAYINSFKPIETGDANIYCFDYPKNSITQGFILFPTLGTKIESRYLKIALDSLLTQINQDNQLTIDEINSTFNSSSVFNSKPNKYFERYYNMYNTLPRNLESSCKNINFNYFIDGYIIHPNDIHSDIKYYTQQLLLTTNEYKEIHDVFKNINLQILLKDPSNNNKKLTKKSIQKIFKQYSVTSNHHYKNPTLADFFYETCGYKTSNDILKNIYIKYLFTHKDINSSELFDILEKINQKFIFIYTIESDLNYYFLSNDQQYYWIDESILP